MNTTASAVGYAAAILTTISFVPQVSKGLANALGKRRFARHVFFVYAGYLHLACYGVLIESWPVILANFVTLVLAGMVSAMKLKFG